MASATAPSAKYSYVPEILEEHYEEVQFLWANRTAALRSPRFTVRELGQLEERIEAHVQGMLAVGEPMRDLVEPGLSATEATIAFASAFALLRLDKPPTTRLVLDRFATAEGPALDGIREALCHAAPANSLRELDFLAGGDQQPVAVAALEVLLWKSTAKPALDRIAPFLSAESPAARRGAWRMLAHAGLAADPKAYSTAMRDDDSLVQKESIWAAVWARVPGILALARKFAGEPNPAYVELYRVLATVGKREDLARVERLAHDAALGPTAVRLSLVGTLGSPSHIPWLIDQMSDPDAETAVAAGSAFTQMTGADVSSAAIAKLPPAEPTGDAAIDEEFAEEAPLPDPARARVVWSELGPALENADRICRGADVSQGASLNQLATFDLASRWDMAARNRFYGLHGPSLNDLLRFPKTQ